MFKIIVKESTGKGMILCNKLNLRDEENPRVIFITVDYAPFSQTIMKNNSASRSYSVIILPALIIMQLIM